jgi:hypothetical protein
MASTKHTHTRSRAPGKTRLPRERSRFCATDFRECFGEELSQTLQIDQWHSGSDLAAEYGRIEREIHEAVQQEGGYAASIREKVFPQISAKDGPQEAGFYQIDLDRIQRIHREILFPGAVEACDGTSQVHDSLALTVYQIGVGLVSYGGDQGTWSQRLFRRDLREAREDPLEELLTLFENRDRREALQHGHSDDLSELAQRGIMTYAERAILLRKPKAMWRMGHGNPAAHELLFAPSVDLTIESIKILRDLIGKHKRFVFVASEPRERALITLGQALYPLEYLLVGTLEERLSSALEDWRASHEPTVDCTWDGSILTPAKWVMRFMDELAPQVLYGVYRATLLGPPQIFYVHREHCHVGAAIAIADSALQEQRGFPMLLDLADRVCASVYGGGSLRHLADATYSNTGAAFRYQSERPTRIKQ